MESNKTALPEGWTPPRPTQSVQPNCLGYHDNNGIEHRIYTPKGTFKIAWDHVQNQRWDELKKFDPYTNQGYTADDYVPTIRDAEGKVIPKNKDTEGETSAKSKPTN